MPRPDIHFVGIWLPDSKLPGIETGIWDTIVAEAVQNLSNIARPPYSILKREAQPDCLLSDLWLTMIPAGAKARYFWNGPSLWTASSRYFGRTSRSWTWTEACGMNKSRRLSDGHSHGRHIGKWHVPQWPTIQRTTSTGRSMRFSCS